MDKNPQEGKPPLVAMSLVCFLLAPLALVIGSAMGNVLLIALSFGIVLLGVLFLLGPE